MAGKEVKLPLLPIPPLDHTVECFLARVRPLISPTDYAAAEGIARRFVMGSGKRIHDALTERSRAASASWLKPFWDDAYLNYRGELNGGMNYFTMLDTKKIPRRSSFAEFCAVMVAALVDTYCKIVDGNLAEEKSSAGLCTEQYRNIFGTCRIPLPERDVLWQTEMSSLNRHISVHRRDAVYILPITDENGKCYSVAALTESIAEILQRTEYLAPNVGILTTAGRDHAAELRRQLCQADGRNADNFSFLDNALFALCLDEPENNRDENEVAFDALYGRGRNRWFDKCVQLIIATDYTVAFNNEHTGFDGAAWMDILRHAYSAMCADYGQEEVNTAPYPLRLDWTIDDTASASIHRMEEENRERGKNLHVRLFRFADFGATDIKKQKTSPDAFFHLALQLAWFRMRGRLNSTYEAVSMRHFYQGRTECMRPGTCEVLAFVRAFGENPGDTARLVDLAQKARERHGEMLAECRAGQAPERHLFGMENTAKADGIKLPADENIFSSEAYRILKHDTISTSGLSAEGVSAFGFAPVVSDGFGVGYGIFPDDIRLCVSCFDGNKTDLDTFIRELETALKDVVDSPAAAN